VFAWLLTALLIVNLRFERLVLQKPRKNCPKTQESRLVNSCNRVSFWRPNPARHLFLQSSVGLKTKFTEWSKICATAGYWWRSKVKMTKQFTINHLYWRWNQLYCFNSNWRQKCPSLRQKFACRPEIGPKHCDKP